MGDRGHNRHWPKRGDAVPFSGGQLGPRLTRYGLGRGLLPYWVASSSIQQSGHNIHGPKTGGSAPLWGEAAGFPSNTMSLGLRPTSLPSGILIYPAIWPQHVWAENWGASPPFGGVGAESQSNTMSRERRPTSYQVASWSIQPFGHKRYGPKIGGFVLFWREGVLGLHKQCGQGEAYLHAKFHFDPSNRLATVL